MLVGRGRGGWLGGWRARRGSREIYIKGKLEWGFRLVGCLWSTEGG